MDNYTGPYWSDGRFQTSVEFGESKPTSELDAASRLHDSAYARFGDQQHRRAADVIYAETTNDIGGASAFVGQAVKYGNYAINAASELSRDVGWGFELAGELGALVGLAYAEYKFITDIDDWNENSMKYISDVNSYYLRDPHHGDPLYYYPAAARPLPVISNGNGSSVVVTPTPLETVVGVDRPARRRYPNYTIFKRYAPKNLKAKKTRKRARQGQGAKSARR